MQLFRSYADRNRECLGAREAKKNPRGACAELSNLDNKDKVWMSWIYRVCSSD